MVDLEDQFCNSFDISEDVEGCEKVKSEKSYKTITESAKNIQSFERWPDLAPELKMEVVKHLDYFTRTKLSFCSRNDYDVVNSCPIQISKIEIRDSGDENHYISKDRIESLSVTIEFENYKVEKNKQMVRLNFIKRESDTEIAWLKHYVKQKPVSKFIKLEGRDYYEEAVKFVEKWMKLSRYNVNSLTVEMKRWPFEESSIQKLPSCDKIRICNENESFITWWLEKVRPNLKSLQLVSRGSKSPLSPELLSTEHFKLCDSLHIWGWTDFTDEQFLGMTASFINIESDTITDKAINQFIEKWVNGKIRKNFRIFFIWRNRRAVEDEVLKNITFQPWNDSFKNDKWGFCNDWGRVIGKGDCYQIDKGDGSGDSATLDIRKDRITFGVTGRRVKYRNREHMSYGIPSGV